MAAYSIRTQIFAAGRITYVLRPRKNSRTAGRIKKRGETDCKWTGRTVGIRQADTNQPARALSVISNTVAAVAVIDGDGFLVVVRRLRISGPTPSVAADLSGGIEVIHQSKRHSQAVMIWRDGLRVLGQRGIAVAAGQVTENLIIGLVLFDDVNNVINPALEESHHRVGISVGDAVIVIDLLGESG